MSNEQPHHNPSDSDEPEIGQKPNKSKTDGKLPKGYVGWVSDYEWHGPISQRPPKPRNDDDEWTQLPGRNHGGWVWTARPKILNEVDRNGAALYKDGFVMKIEGRYVYLEKEADSRDGTGARHTVKGTGNKINLKLWDVDVSKITSVTSGEREMGVSERLKAAKAAGNVLWKASAPGAMVRYIETTPDTKAREVKNLYLSMDKEYMDGWVE